MAQGFGRIPLKLEFDENFGCREEFAERLARTGIFSLRKLNRNYFSSIVDSILRDEDPLPIIDASEPEIDGSPHMILCVGGATSSEHSQSTAFVYHTGMTEEDFNLRCLEALDALKARNEGVILNGTGLRALKAFFGISSLSKKELADAYFMNKDYESALYIYARLSSLGICRRMSEICRALMDIDMLGDPLSLDIMIFYKKFDTLYAISGDLPFDAKLAVQYYLTKQGLPQHMRVLLEYSCCKGFSTIKDSKRLFSTLDSLKSFAGCKNTSSATDVQASSNFWIDCKQALEFEFGDGPGDAAKQPTPE